MGSQGAERAGVDQSELCGMAASASSLYGVHVFILRLLLDFFFLCILNIFCLFNEILSKRALNIETLLHYSLFGTVLCLKGTFIRKDYFSRELLGLMSLINCTCIKPPESFKNS